MILLATIIKSVFWPTLCLNERCSCVYSCEVCCTRVAYVCKCKHVIDASIQTVKNFLTAYFSRKLLLCSLWSYKYEEKS